MNSRQQFQEFFERLMQQEVNQLIKTVPYANHLSNPDQGLNEDYYCRHRIETIKRIRLTSETDALALAAMVKEDYEAARFWSRYTAQELSHDLLFLKDLKQHGYTDDRVDSTEPFSATLEMIDYLKVQIHHFGSLPAIAYSLFVEWNAEQASDAVVQKVEKTFSPAHVLGAKAHEKIDQDHNHYAMMVDIAYRLVSHTGDPTLLIALITDIATFFRDYFQELYEATAAQTENSVMNLFASDARASLEKLIQAANEAGYDVEVLN